MSKPTTFILVGGNERGVQGYAKRLEDELAKHVSSPKILSCFFSVPADDWLAKYQDWKQWFSTNFNGSFTYDYAKKETFLRQIDNADVIYLHGGNTQLLFDTLPDVDELRVMKDLTEHPKIGGKRRLNFSDSSGTEKSLIFLRGSLS